MQSCYASQALQKVRQQNGIVHPVFFEAPCANFISLILIITFLLRLISSEFFFFFTNMQPKWSMKVYWASVIYQPHHAQEVFAAIPPDYRASKRYIFFIHPFTYFFLWHLGTTTIIFLYNAVLKNDKLMIVEMLYLSRPSMWLNCCFVAAVNKLLCLF